MKKALIFGGTGQMGSYLVELLSRSGYLVKSVSSGECNFEWSSDVLGWKMREVLRSFGPDEVYNFAGQMHAQESWKNPLAYTQVNGAAVHVLLEAIWATCPAAKFFNAGSADMFDKSFVTQDESTPRNPDNPHGLSKLMAYELVKLYRQRKSLFAVTGIFFNAESPRRSNTFFARKVVSEVARLKREMVLGTFKPIQLGRLDARRDWGWAPEYVEVAWKMLQQEKPVDLVIGTGETHTCKEFVEEALKAACLSDVEKRFDEYVQYEKEDGYRTGDTMSARPTLAAMTLGWEAKFKFKDVVKMLVEAEMEVKREVAVG